MHKFSIIIPVRTINDFLKESISHLKELNYKDFEVLIIQDFDSGYKINDKRFKVIMAPAGKQSPGEKRNLGAEKSTGDILAFLDDDAYPKRDWLKQADKIFEKKKDLYALGAPAMTPPNVSLLELVSGRILESYLTSGFTYYRHIPLKQIYIDDYPTVNLFVKKDAFDKIGGFDKEFWPGEDTKLCLDLVKDNGKKFLYNPKPQVYHHRRYILIPHLKQISRYGRHRGQFARIFPETSFVPSYFVPSIFLLGLILGPIISMLFPWLWSVYFSVITLYLLFIFIEGLQASIKSSNILVLPLFIIGTFLTHVVYGFNFIVGLFKRPKLQLREVDIKTGNYLGG